MLSGRRRNAFEACPRRADARDLSSGGIIGRVSRHRAHAFLVVLCVGIADAQEADNIFVGAEGGPLDVGSMGIEELLNLQLSATNVLGIHHTHPRGEWMIGYQYMLMAMDGNRDGTSRKSTREVLQDFMIAPTEMTMEMHMFEIMYGLTDKWTLMGMISYDRKSMDHITRTGVRFTTESEGFSDLKLMGLHKFWENGRHRLHFTAGLSVPTGSIDEMDTTPAGLTRLPYPMQIGSGTVDLLPGLTYSGHQGDWFWGARTGGTVRLGRNDREYSLGDDFNLDAWGSRIVTEWLSLSFQVNGRVWGNIDGADPALNPAMVPTADPDRRGGERIDLLAGINLFRNRGKLKGNRISIEAGLPVYQSLDGPQLETDWIFKFAWRWAF